MEHKDSLFISWENASAIISKQLYIILWESFVCKAELQQDDYWSTKIHNRQLAVYELLKICDAVDAPYDARMSAMPDDDQKTSSISMELSLCLLTAYLKQDYEKVFFDKDGILIVGKNPDEGTAKNTHMFLHNGTTINIAELKSSSELKEYLNEWGATFTSLNDFCEAYTDKYQNPLYWHYPYSDDKHNGLYFVLCSDGILCLPYDQMDGEYFEYFELEDARFLDTDSINILIDDWIRFSVDLVDAMQTMKEWLNK